MPGYLVHMAIDAHAVGHAPDQIGFQMSRRWTQAVIEVRYGKRNFKGWGQSA
jgi:hypothetical protein